MPFCATICHGKRNYHIVYSLTLSGDMLIAAKRQLTCLLGNNLLGAILQLTSNTLHYHTHFFIGYTSTRLTFMT